jgi:nascent polypeptide-associated complex subunit alpha
MTDSEAPAAAEETSTTATPEAEVSATPAAADPPPTPSEPTKRKNSRAEKKMKDGLLKYGLTKLEGVTTVMMRKAQQLIWTFNNPDVYQLENVYVIFGEPSMQSAGDEAVKELKKTAVEDETPAEPKPTIVEDETAANEETPSDLKEDDITTLMGQAGVTRPRAIEALRDAGGDLVTAVMNYRNSAMSNVISPYCNRCQSLNGAVNEVQNSIEKFRIPIGNHTKY